jgi:hypothetical protein
MVRRLTPTVGKPHGDAGRAESARAAAAAHAESEQRFRTFFETAPFGVARRSRRHTPQNDAAHGRVDHRLAGPGQAPVVAREAA